MAQPKGVADHPAKAEMEALWRQGMRAKGINQYLQDHGYPVVATQTLARYGQRYWTDSVRVELEHDDASSLQAQIEELSELGTVKRVAVRSSVTRSGPTSSTVIEVTPSRSMTLERARPPKINLSYKVAKFEGKPEGWKVGVKFPDMQIGYWDDGQSQFCTHDEAAIDVAHQIAADVNARYGLDLIVNVGDNLDLPAFGSHRSAPAFMHTTQMAIDRAAEEAATQRQLAPDADIVWLEGNHECLSADTRAVTKDGLKHWHELKIGDLVLSCDDDQQPLWQPVQAVHSYWYRGDMVSWGGRTDMLVTPNHRVVGFEPNAYRKGSLRWKESLAGSYTSTVIPTALRNTRPEADISDDEIAIIAWALSDSHVTSHGYWTFYQRESKVERILALLDRMGLQYNAYRRDRGITEICGKRLKEKPEASFEVRLDAESSRVVSDLIPDKSSLPDVLYSLSKRQMGVLLEELVYTDGSIPTRGTTSRVIYHSRDTRYDLQRLFLLGGYSCTLTEYRPNHWRLNIAEIEATRTDASTVKRVPYEGLVWCVTVENGRFFASRESVTEDGRRTEHPFLTGNSRLTKYLVDRAPALVGLNKGGQTGQPVMSLSNLCRFDEYGIEYLEPYPDAELWVNDHLRFEHGSIARATPGATAAKYLSNGVSVGYGHIHRQELLQATRHTSRGPRTHFAGSAGCLARIDGAVPSAKTGITSRGAQAIKKAEAWQQGIWVFWWQPEGDQLVAVEPVSIWGGWALFRGREYVASCDVEGRPL